MGRPRIDDHRQWSLTTTYRRKAERLGALADAEREATIAREQHEDFEPKPCRGCGLRRARRLSTVDYFGPTDGLPVCACGPKAEPARRKAARKASAA